jgi:hypothetical protein
MLITVTEIDPPDGSTVTVGHGVEVETDRRIRFACDWRPAMAIFDAISQGEDVEVELESWQILGGS